MRDNAENLPLWARISYFDTLAHYYFRFDSIALYAILRFPASPFRFHFDSHFAFTGFLSALCLNRMIFNDHKPVGEISI